MARRSHAEIVKEYNKEYDRIRKQIERMAKRGYDVEGLKPERISKKDIKAKDLEKLKKLTNEKIYQLAKGGAEKRKEERAEAARKGWQTRRSPKPGKPEEPPTPPTVPPKKAPKAPKPPKEPKAPTPKKPPVPPGTPAGEGPGEDGLTDEEEAALQRFYEDIDKYNSAFVEKMKAWLNRVIARSSRKAAAKMFLDAWENGVYIPYEAAYLDDLMFSLQEEFLMYLPENMTDEDRDMSEDEWQDLVDEIADDEDFPFF